MKARNLLNDLIYHALTLGLNAIVNEGKAPHTLALLQAELGANWEAAVELSLSVHARSEGGKNMRIGIQIPAGPCRSVLPSQPSMVLFIVEDAASADGLGEIVEIAERRAELLRQLKTALVAQDIATALQIGKRLCQISETDHEPIRNRIM